MGLISPTQRQSVSLCTLRVGVNPEGFLRQQYEERQAAGLARPQEEVGKDIRDQLESLRERYTKPLLPGKIC